MNKSLLTLSLYLLICSFLTSTKAQKIDAISIAKKYLSEQKSQWQLTQSDVQDMQLSDHYKSQHNELTHVYFIQTHKGIALHKAIAGVHIQKDGTPFYATSKFTSELAEKVNATSPTLSAEQAIWKAVEYLEIVGAKSPVLKAQKDKHTFTFEAASTAAREIEVQLCYQKVSDEKVRLAWHLSIDMLNNSDYWSIHIDAITGELLEKNNYTVYCNHRHSTPTGGCEYIHATTNHIQAINLPLNAATESYDIFPFPLESPIHGERQVVVAPADLNASPFGWHDTDGVEGAEYTITRGNNVHAFQDILAQDRSQRDEPDGGDDLFFDFPYDPDAEPDTYTDFATVQLFYANNYLHDFIFAYGMDEAAGAFQTTNYTGVSGANDPVLAQAQDGSGTNNANFGTPPDGGSGSMQMFLFNVGNGGLTVTEPATVAGIYATRAANFGPQVDTIPISGEVVLVDDGTFNGTLGCNPLINDLTEKVAMIDRGDCFFTEKVYNAQLAGAVGAIICNADGLAMPAAMGAGTDDPISIPSVMIDFPECQQLKAFLGRGLMIDLVIPSQEGPLQVDGTLDNGIIAHEYGHGISNRLTAGPRRADCLFSDEQMGEGWSDFFTLVTTVTANDEANRKRTIGGFAVNQSVEGSGFRSQAYSPDFSVNNKTYLDVLATTAPHPLGEVWVATLWDLYWAMVDEHGFDEDLVNGTGGNNMAVQLVVDGLKLQPCSPGFIDGRDAILAADVINYDGANQCLIWKVFSRRGFGFEADQRDADNRNDAKENFDTRPDCIKTLKIEKRMTPNIDLGENIEVELTVTNHKEDAVTEVSFYDLFPAGTAFNRFLSVPEGVEARADLDQVTFRSLDMASGTSIQVTYELTSDPNIFSTTIFEDDMENGDLNWNFYPLDEEAFQVWEIFEEEGVDGSFAWAVASSGDVAQDQVLELVEPIKLLGEQPVLAFTHRYETEWAYDGGFIQISSDGVSWETVGDLFFRNGYETRLDFFTIPIPRLQAFGGDGAAFRTSYVDLSEFVGQEINVRFRFGSDDQRESFGWIVDDIEIFDMANYDSEACVTSDEGDLVCTRAVEKGTIVASSLAVSTEELIAADQMKLFPNPSAGFAHLTFNSAQSGNIQLQILDATGKSIQQQQEQVQAGYNYLALDLHTLSAGIYFVAIQTASGRLLEKLIVE
ncbi:MAG: M36 family metallopeptidase [Bacteroidota bacterium]